MKRVVLAGATAALSLSLLAGVAVAAANHHHHKHELTPPKGIACQQWQMIPATKANWASAPAEPTWICLSGGAAGESFTGGSTASLTPNTPPVPDCEDCGPGDREWPGRSDRRSDRAKERAHVNANDRANHNPSNTPN